MSPDSKADLDGFSIVLPLPYRVALILVAGFWGWAVNLHYLSKVNIDVPALIRYPARKYPNQKAHHTSAYHLATLLTVTLVLSLLVFWAVTKGYAELVERHEFVPQFYLLIFVCLLFLPYNRVAHSGRHRLFVCLRRVSIGGLAQAQDGKFGDILLADAITSYSRVLGDLFISQCMFFSRGISSTGKPDRSCGKGFIVPLILIFPSIIRFRQCLIEFFRVRVSAPERDSTGWQYLGNALKYSTTWPVVGLATASRNYDPVTSSFGLSEAALERLLSFFLFINSSYCFYWDVTKDWDLTLLSQARNNPEYPYGLRRHRHFPSDTLYYAAIAVNLLLRFSWVWPISTHFQWLKDRESGIFILMTLEVVRRWVWIFFRVEAEWVRNNGGPAPDDILLGDLNRKWDSD